MVSVAFFCILPISSVLFQSSYGGTDFDQGDATTEHEMDCPKYVHVI